MQLDQAKDGNARNHGNDEWWEEAYFSQIDTRDRVITLALIKYLNSKKRASFEIKNFQENQSLVFNSYFYFLYFNVTFLSYDLYSKGFF